MGRPVQLSAALDVAQLHAMADRLCPDADMRIASLRMAAGQGGTYRPQRGYLFSEVWGAQDENGHPDPRQPGLVGRLRIDPERDMTSRWESFDEVTQEQRDVVVAWVTSKAGKTGDVPRQVRVWRFRSDFDPTDYPRP